ncbi:MAG: LysR family transcriptional regulator [Pseudomonadota bacterium]
MKTNPDRIELMQTFVRIVEAGSLSAAAAQLGTTQPTVSRRLQMLERSLGVLLLQRSTHGMKLTEDGTRCFTRAREMLGSWEAFEADLRGAREVPEGTLRVVMPHAFGQQQLVAPLAAYLRQYEKVTVEWLLHDRVPDFIAENVDCALLVGEVHDPSVVAIRVAEVPRIVVARPDLAENMTASQQPSALETLPWLALGTYYRNEVALRHTDGREHRFPIRPRLVTDSLFAMRSAILEGLGAGIVSSWIAAEDIAQGRLLHLAPQWHAPALPMYLIYPYSHFYPARLQRFVEVLRKGLADLMGLPEPSGFRLPDTLPQAA